MQKIKSLMARQGLKSPQESVVDMSPVESFRTPSKEELRELREQPTDPQAEQEIIDSIEEVYFSSDSFDMVQYELEKLPPDLNLLELEEYRYKLKRQQAALSYRLSQGERCSTWDPWGPRCLPIGAVMSKLFPGSAVSPGP
ncbi:syndetin-like [Danio aesculapii]|uniref:syndetin-like n=1 Tax=Danio aesculapii TaxID=1142201 RepID=UPI0024BF8CA8|nr:syndetin-like [Danio aesculapii]